MTDSIARFCPQCGSPTITISSFLVEGAALEAKCEKCQWEGAQEDLLAAPFQHDMGSDEQVLQIFARDIRNVFAATAAKDVGLLLQRWGFLVGGTPQEQVKVLSRYLTVMTKAMALAVLDERKAIAKENPNVA